ncbi:MAG: acetyl-CoA hydrolase [Acidobacteriia bacterium]|nr:acetyl-CoA hydrolase [Terriglobia bacterium]
MRRVVPFRLWRSPLRTHSGDAFGGFTTAGNPVVIGAALAAHAARERSAGRAFEIGNIGVATGASMDGILADAIAVRTPYQSAARLRARINAGQCRFFDAHLSHLTQQLRYGFLGRIDWAVVQAAEIAPDGEALLTSAIGGAPTFCHLADRVLIELNHAHPAALRGFHDIYEPADPPHRREIPIYRASDRIGSSRLRVDPAKIAGVVECEAPDEGAGFDPLGEITDRIGANVAEFLAGELAAGRLPSSFLPIQSGVGDIANAVLRALGSHPGVPPFEMYTEIIQDAVIALMQAGRVRFASCCALTLSREALRHVYDNLEDYRSRILLRPQEITNHPEVIRRLGVIAMNTALEADIFGNVNSTHVLGRNMMNGIGGSGDFTRNGYLSIFSCPSTAKAGRISTIVPMVTHVDHSEHSVQVLATEWGVADLRSLSPNERARRIIERCAHPDYRDELFGYLKLAEGGHTAHTLRAAFGFHERFQETGDMR